MEYYTSLPHGIFLVTGPTGSGKSTTLYSALKRINHPDKKIITIEDPVEYQMDGINQLHVNTQIGLTFAAGIRHIVRQDPDVIMIGEIRDRETADIAIRSALDGPLRVFHAAYERCAERDHTADGHGRGELPDVFIAGVRAGATAGAHDLQALPCRRRVHDTRRMAIRSRHIAGAGCEHCFGTGFTGRVGIFELMELNDEIRRKIMAGADAIDLTQAAKRNGMRTPSRGRLAEGSRRRDHRRRSDARDAGILGSRGNELLLPRGRFRRQASHRSSSWRDRKVGRE